MKLYHFTPTHLLDDIKIMGLTRGMIPILKSGRNGDRKEDFKVIPGYQNLTVNKAFNQSWEEQSSLPYRRNAVRITVKIPKNYRCNLFYWLRFCDAVNLNSARVLNSYGDPENWYVYRGKIPPKWFRAIDFRPGTLAERIGDFTQIRV